MLLVANTIRVQTNKGALIFTSLFNRDKTYDEITNMLNGKRLNIANSEEKMI